MKTQNSRQTATLTLPTGQEITLPVLEGSVGPDVVDVRSLYADSGYFTYDPGFASTASCDSQLTYIDGEAGTLLHRGYRIEELARTASYTEVCWLLLHGELPHQDNLDTFNRLISEHTMLHEQMQHLFRGFRRDAHPMAIVVALVAALSAFYPDSLDVADQEQRQISAVRLLAKMPTIAAYAFKHTSGKPFVYPNNALSYVDNFLYMLFGLPTYDYKSNSAVIRALERIFILHADHEQNASTSVVRMAGSSLANPFACVSCGVSALWGPSHGGANEAVVRMLQEIGSPDRIKTFIERAKDKDDSFRLMGFGHRVYKNYDPRASVLRESCMDVLQSLGIENEPLFDLARRLEQVALEDSYFVERKLFPNVDFYSGIILRAIGLPTSMFTVIFALARTVGWIAQWKEMIEDPQLRISRPRQLYKGPAERELPEVRERQEILLSLSAKHHLFT